MCLFVYDVVRVSRLSRFQLASVLLVFHACIYHVYVWTITDHTLVTEKAMINELLR